LSNQDARGSVRSSAVEIAVGISFDYRAAFGFQSTPTAPCEKFGSPEATFVAFPLPDLELGDMSMIRTS
jgi:hypothetical protein